MHRSVRRPVHVAQVERVFRCIDPGAPAKAVDRARAAGVDVLVSNEGEPGVDSEWYGEAAGLTAINYAIMRDPEGNVVQIDQRTPAA